MSTNLKKILLVEDEDDIRNIAQISLEQLGKFQMAYAKSGMEALEFARDFKPDLILLDMMMPGMDGVQTFKVLKEDKNTKHIPIIFMTAKVQTNEINEYLKLGVLEVISKPFDPIKLPEKVREIWEKYKTKSPA